MKKILSSLVMTAAFASLAVSPAEAVDKCAKLNSIKKVNGQIFVCTKNKKSLTWKLQKVISIPVTEQNPIVVVSETLSAKSNVIPVAEPIMLQNPIVIFNIDNLSVIEVYNRSREQINNKINSSKYNDNIFNFNASSEIDSTKLQNEKDALIRAAKLWSNIYTPSYKVETIFYTSESVQWAKTKFKDITGQEGINQVQNCLPTWCGNASVSIIGNKPIVYEQGMGGLDLTMRSTSSHEYTHLAQTSGNSQYWNLAPLWLVEGMAQFYGEAVGFSVFDNDGKTRSNIHQIFANYYKSITQENIKEKLLLNDKQITRSIFIKLEFPNNRYSQESANLAYLIGGYATEVLVSVYGQDKIEDFIMSFNTSNNWESNFYNSFGISKDDFYDKITIYLSQVAKDL